MSLDYRAGLAYGYEIPGNIIETLPDEIVDDYIIQTEDSTCADTIFGIIIKSTTEPQTLPIAGIAIDPAKADDLIRAYTQHVYPILGGAFPSLILFLQVSC